jgi:hypothetical protein
VTPWLQTVSPKRFFDKLIPKRLAPDFYLVMA